MRRREFITLLSGTAAAWPLPAHAQRSGVSRGFLSAASPAQFIDAAFREGLREAGFIEGQNVTIECRWAKGVYERLPALAAELVGLRIDLLAALGTSRSTWPSLLQPRPSAYHSGRVFDGSDPVAEGTSSKASADRAEIREAHRRRVPGDQGSPPRIATSTTGGITP